MIELKTNPDTLHAMATEVMADRIKADVLNAAHDLKNLRDYAEGLERNTHQMSSEIQSIRTQRDEAAAALLAIFKPELEKMIDASVDDCRALSDITDRLDNLEDPGNLTDTVRGEVKDMIRDGDITISIDHV